MFEKNVPLCPLSSSPPWKTSLSFDSPWHFVTKMIKENSVSSPLGYQAIGTPCTLRNGGLCKAEARQIWAASGHIVAAFVVRLRVAVRPGKRVLQNQHPMAVGQGERG